MFEFSIALAVALWINAAIQIIYAWAFARLLRSHRPPPDEGHEWPKAAILLSLRGADPHLLHGLRKLMTQNYPDYELRIVVDRMDDPSVDLVRRAIKETSFERARISPIRQLRKTCSLKCSALAQLAEDLDESVEVVVLADADLVSHANWMRELIRPLADESVGASFGNRWFWPRRARWGSLVRYLWNAAAVVPMYALGIPWGGTFAIRAAVLRDTGLLDKWTRAAVEDAPVRTALERHGLAIRFVPSLMMVNREECGVGFALDFIKRQLTWTRLYHPRWGVVVLHALNTTGVLAAALIMTSVALLLGRWAILAYLGGSLAVYFGVLVLLLSLIEGGVRNQVGGRGEEPFAYPLRAYLKMLSAVPLTQAIYMVAVLMAIFRCHVSWRGVTYRIRGPWDVQMVQYQPFDQAAQPRDTNTSL